MKPLRRVTLFLLFLLLVPLPLAHAAPDDLGTGGDAGDTLQTAAEITLIEGTLEGTGWLDETDLSDAYHVEVGFHKQITVTLEPPADTDYDLDLHGRYQDLEASSTNPEGEQESVEWLSAGSILGETSDHIYVNVRRVTGQGQYTLTITVEETINQDDMGTGGDAGNTIDDATLVAPGTGNGYTWPGDREDYYKTTVEPGQTVTAIITSNTGAYDITLYDANQLRVDADNHNPVEDPGRVTWTATHTGYFYIYVRFTSYVASSYTLEITATEPQPDNQPPEAYYEWWITEGTLHVDASESGDPDGSIAGYTWYIDGEIDESLTGQPTWTWTDIPPGSYTVTLKVVDDLGEEDTARATIEVTAETPVDDIVETFGIPSYPAAAIVAGLLAFTLLRKAKPKGKMRHHGSHVHGLHPWIV